MKNETVNRVRKGEFYYIPETATTGCYKARERNDQFDERMARSGMYFATEKEAKEASRMLRERHVEHERLSLIIGEWIVRRVKKRRNVG